MLSYEYLSFFTYGMFRRKYESLGVNPKLHYKTMIYYHNLQCACTSRALAALREGR